MLPEKKKSRFVTMDVAPKAPEAKPLPEGFYGSFVCPDCGEPIFRHSSGRFWCEECGDLKDHVKEAKRERKTTTAAPE